MGKFKTAAIRIAFILPLALLAIGGNSSAGAAAPIRMSWVSFLPRTNQSVQGIQKYLFDKINERAKGQLVVTYRGGPEVIPGYEQGAAVQKGVVDFSMVPVGFYEPLAPGAGGLMLSQISLDQERKPGGAYDYLVELHKKGGLMYLGRAANTAEPYFYLHLNVWPKTRNDFKSLKIGTSAGSRAAVEGWGATQVNMKPPDYYPALERGVIDGVAGIPLVSAIDLGIQEVIKYTVDDPYWVSTAVIIMNLKRWNNLPDKLKNIIMTTMIQAEKEQMKQDEIDRPKARAKMIKAGVQFRKFPPDMAKWFITTAYNSAWEFQQKRFPKVTPKLRELLTKH